MSRKRQESRQAKSSGGTCDQNGCTNPTSGNNRQCNQCTAIIAAGAAASAAAIVVINN